MPAAGPPPCRPAPLAALIAASALYRGAHGVRRGVSDGLDQIARSMAAPISRRRSLRLLGLGLAAAILGVPRAAEARRTPRQAYQLCPTPCSATPGSCLVEYTCCGRGKCCPPWMDCFQPCTVSENCVCKPEFVCGGACCAPPSQMQCVVGICCPVGATNCAGNCCAAGMECVQGELCLEPCQPGAVRCGDLHTCCQPGGECVDGRCIAPCNGRHLALRQVRVLRQPHRGVPRRRLHPEVQAQRDALPHRLLQAGCALPPRVLRGLPGHPPGLRRPLLPGRPELPPARAPRPAHPGRRRAADLLPAGPASRRWLLRGRQPRAQRPLRRGLRSPTPARSGRGGCPRRSGAPR